MAGRDEGRDVAETVGVQPEPDRGRVLDARGRKHDEHDLHAHEARLSGEQRHEQCPGRDADRTLSREAGVVVEPCSERHPGDDHARYEQVSRQAARDAHASS